MGLSICRSPLLKSTAFPEFQKMSFVLLGTSAELYPGRNNICIKIVALYYVVAVIFQVTSCPARIGNFPFFCK